jgi:hypothetical protein
MAVDAYGNTYFGAEDCVRALDAFGRLRWDYCFQQPQQVIVSLRCMIPAPLSAVAMHDAGGTFACGILL